jgi:hypothetical protein
LLQELQEIYTKAVRSHAQGVPFIFLFRLSHWPATEAEAIEVADHGLATSGARTRNRG